MGDHHSIQESWEKGGGQQPKPDLLKIKISEAAKERIKMSSPTAALAARGQLSWIPDRQGTCRMCACVLRTDEM